MNLMPGTRIPHPRIEITCAWRGRQAGKALFVVMGVFAGLSLDREHPLDSGVRSLAPRSGHTRPGSGTGGEPEDHGQ